MRGDFGPFYNGHRNGGQTTLTYRHGASLSTSLLVDYNNVHLLQGDFDRKLPRKLTYAAETATGLVPALGSELQGMLEP